MKAITINIPLTDQVEASVRGRFLEKLAEMDTDALKILHDTVAKKGAKAMSEKVKKYKNLL